ncbi:formate--tetrahydrofolate ligase [Paenibacillus selenitireducens]|uniref:Formate--tetrahydrofolate ligase n=2 Tax=Paenibacillus selenitireducens TaxID=1324314 RepID=A0A1T2XKX0_9BACL|nr:formate--tetrahydrofolate ligase [Paenibacillus selenitireducens]
MKPIIEIARQIGLDEDDLELYGKYKAKISFSAMERVQDRPAGKLILVTAMNPTPAGEGKTLTSIGLSQAMNQIGKKTIAALREPSLGPCMGLKGGATGSGGAQIVPADEINMHFTGDLHAISSAHNLLAAMVDNHIFHGNELGINPEKVVWKRAVDMNDRAMRHTVIGLQNSGVVREDGHLITVASEIMAIFCLSENIADLRERLGRMIVAYSYDGNPITAKDLRADGAMTALLKDALQPNLVQTCENTPVLVHGGPFANIAHGCSSLMATKLGLKLADYVVTEAGFGADLGAEKFVHIKCRTSGLKPNAAVLVVTAKSMKYNGGVDKGQLTVTNATALLAGFANVKKHVENMHGFGIPVVVAINRFATDTEEEIQMIQEQCREIGIKAVVSQVWAQGGEGGRALAEEVVRLVEDSETQLRFLYELHDGISDKIETIVREVYGGAKVNYSARAKAAIRALEASGLSDLPICMAKTPYSFSDQPKLLGRPAGFTLTVNDIRVSAGAGFVVVFTGNVMIMPGLPKHPLAEEIDVDAQGNILNLS